MPEIKIFTTIEQMHQYCRMQRKKGLSIGFVPTMGALHTGHVQLVEQSVEENDITVCSIFVNPIQFNNPADLEKYPRTFESDVAMLESASCDAVFYPENQEMYPEKPGNVYDFGLLEQVMEGRFRKGHFNGVAIVVKKLLEIVVPHRAYFGEKDYQQLAIINKLVENEKIPVEIVPCPTVREDDGLAMSSRNKRLNVAQRRQAPLIYNTLVKAKEMYKTKRVDEVIDYVSKAIGANPEMKLEYFEISDTQTLQPVRENKPDKPVVACIAVYMGPVRLIDNMLFNL